LLQVRVLSPLRSRCPGAAGRTTRSTRPIQEIHVTQTRGDAPADRPARSAQSAKPARAAGRTSGGLLARLSRFVREVVAELGKVIWPTRKELVTYTIVVIVFVSAMTAIVTGLDIGFAKLVTWVFG
jgi:preprotein translocase subunit SecE